jgi:hypothetical protein
VLVPEQHQRESAPVATFRHSVPRRTLRARSVMIFGRSRPTTAACPVEAPLPARARAEGRSLIPSGPLLYSHPLLLARLSPHLTRHCQRLR